MRLFLAFFLLVSLFVAGSRAADIVIEVPQFKRGDANDSGSVNVSDAIYLSNFLFANGDDPACDDAADANDDGWIDVSDIAHIWNYLFAGGAAPPAPGPNTCGFDLTVDGLGCSFFSLGCP